MVYSIIILQHVTIQRGDGMGAWEKVLGLGGAALVLYGISAIKKDNKERALKAEEEKSKLNISLFG